MSLLECKSKHDSLAESLNSKTEINKGKQKNRNFEVPTLNYQQEQEEGQYGENSPSKSQSGNVSRISEVSKSKESSEYDSRTRKLASRQAQLAQEKHGQHNQQVQGQQKSFGKKNYVSKSFDANERDRVEEEELIYYDEYGNEIDPREYEIDPRDYEDDQLENIDNRISEQERLYHGLKGQDNEQDYDEEIEQEQMEDSRKGENIAFYENDPIDYNALMQKKYVEQLEDQQDDGVSPATGNYGDEDEDDQIEDYDQLQEEYDQRIYALNS